jgi:hypothetical protein
MNERKRCGTCGQGKDLSAFGLNSAIGDGLQTQCRECKKRIQARWYAKIKLTHRVNVNQRRKVRAVGINRHVFDYLQRRPCVAAERPSLPC